jgi:hypothetical protein
MPLVLVQIMTDLTLNTTNSTSFNLSQKIFISIKKYLKKLVHKFRDEGKGNHNPSAAATDMFMYK